MQHGEKASSVLISRPQRWDRPYAAEEMTAEKINYILSFEPFRSMDQSQFSVNLPLRDIVTYDTRLRRFAKNEMICRKNDYDNSAFIIFHGEVAVVFLEALELSEGAPRKNKTTNFFQKLAQLWRNPKHPEVRDRDQAHGISEHPATFVRGNFLSEQQELITIEAGGLFGEISALRRAPRSATVFATTEEVEVLEIRWQGLRDIMQRAPEFREHVEQLYRERKLRATLSEVPLFKTLSDAQLDEIAAAALFESYGQFNWYSNYKALLEKPPLERLQSELIIANEDDYVDGLLVISGGFCRISNGHHTVGYLGKFDVFGLEEIIYKLKTAKDISLQHTLRAIGYVDLLRIPTHIIEKHLPAEIVSKQYSHVLDDVQENETAGKVLTEFSHRKVSVDESLMEFLIDNRIINGTATMIIDLERCVHCDECVKACAATHNNNPRFIRHGIRNGRFMIANACMHCKDPVCMVGCPTGAIQRDPRGGQVTINPYTCIGCGTCATNCPYDNIMMEVIRDKNGKIYRDEKTHTPIEQATKCDLCVDHGNGPACERACAHDALKRMDMSEPINLVEWLQQK